MKKLLIIGYLSLALSTHVIAKQHEHEGARGQHWLGALKQLNLTDEQRQQIKSLVHNKEGRRGDFDLEQRLAVAKQRHAVYHILTAEQQQRLDALEQKREQRHAAWGELRAAEQALIRQPEFDEQAWREWFAQAQESREQHQRQRETR